MIFAITLHAMAAPNWKVIGPDNVNFAVKDEKVFVLEVNRAPRAPCHS